MTEQRIYTCLWFDSDAEAAANLYVALFPGARVTHVTRYGAGAPLPEGTALVIQLDLGGTRLMLLNGGPVFRQSEAASIVVECATQGEIDRLWGALTADGGAPGRCGWLKDRFGVSWQIVPARIGVWMTSADAAARGRVMAAIMGMDKLDLAVLEAAFAGS